MKAGKEIDWQKKLAKKANFLSPPSRSSGREPGSQDGHALRAASYRRISCANPKLKGVSIMSEASKGPITGKTDRTTALRGTSNRD